MNVLDLGKQIVGRPRYEGQRKERVEKREPGVCTNLGRTLVVPSKRHLVRKTGTKPFPTVSDAHALFKPLYATFRVGGYSAKTI